jgi:hypothetical protein
MASEKAKPRYLRNLEAFCRLKEEGLQMIDRPCRMRKIRRGEFPYLQGSGEAA